jgi:TRAP-type C4-dicarboxylate transport system permease small subunit
MVDKLFKTLEGVLAFLLLGMVVMVFGNVVLRYAFNSGIVVSEELSRFFFVWLTFVGAIVAMREHAHLGMDNFVSTLSRNGKLMCLAATQIIILLGCGMLFWGTWEQHEVNATNRAPVTGMSMIWIFGIGYVTSIAMALQSLHLLWRIAKGTVSERDLIGVSESEEHMPADHGGASK